MIDDIEKDNKIKSEHRIEIESQSSLSAIWEQHKM